jgi:AcrR family transcriptional regulator
MSETTELLKKLIRTEPIQQRSSARITLLLDAAATIISEHGIEGLTTSDVATRSESSVGVVYRYFPNIRSLLRALAARNLERYVARLEAQPPAESALDGVDNAIGVIVDMMRTEPGFRAIRFGDVIDERLLEPEMDNSGMIAELFETFLVDRHKVSRSAELTFRLQVAVEIADALIKRAFEVDARGNARFIDRARELVRAEVSQVTL